jgi:hypothetical protein
VGGWSLSIGCGFEPYARLDLDVLICSSYNHQTAGCPSAQESSSPSTSSAVWSKSLSIHTYYEAAHKRAVKRVW